MKRLEFTQLAEAIVTQLLQHDQGPDLAQEAVEGLLDKSATILADTLRQDTPRLLRWQRRARRGFEKRLRGRWGAALDSFDIVVLCVAEAASDFNHKYRPVAASECDFT